MNDFLTRIEPDLKNMLGAGRIDLEVYDQLTRIVTQRFEEWSADVSEDLTQKAKDWEQVMGPEKEGFYSLGLRRAVDRIRGNPEP
jgi:hypothetical protein